MKQKRLKKYESKDSSEIRNLIIITVIIALIATGLYFLTEKVLNKKENNKTSEVTFNYDEATIGTMFNRPYDEYYAFIYDSTDDNATVYNNIIKTYRAKDDAKKLYFIDLNDGLNKIAVSDTTNKNPASSEEVKVNGSALYLIKNGKVTSAYTESYDKVLK